MQSLNAWLKEYSDSHRNRSNQIIHKICVPTIAFTMIGFFELIPIHIGILPVGRIFLLATLIWYFLLSPKAFLLMLPFVALAELLYWQLTRLGPPFLPLVAIFVVAWIGQFAGHALEGKRPSFFKDLQFLLIGPLWVFWGSTVKNP